MFKERFHFWGNMAFKTYFHRERVGEACRNRYSRRNVLTFDFEEKSCNMTSS